MDHFYYYGEGWGILIIDRSMSFEMLLYCYCVYANKMQDLISTRRFAF